MHELGCLAAIDNKEERRKHLTSKHSHPKKLQQLLHIASMIMYFKYLNTTSKVQPLNVEIIQPFNVYHQSKITIPATHSSNQFSRLQNHGYDLSHPWKNNHISFIWTPRSTGHRAWARAGPGVIILRCRSCDSTTSSAVSAVKLSESGTWLVACQKEKWCHALSSFLPFF